MKYVELGKTGLMCAQVSFGAIAIQRNDVANAVAVVDALEKHGMNYMDTARAYTVSEEYLGTALAGRRDKFILATKSMSRDYEGMKRDVDISLHNLGTDYIDLYQIHNLPLKDFEQVFGPNGAYQALEEARAAGKIGHIGATFHSQEALRVAVEEYADKIETVMFPWNIVENHGEEYLRQAKAKGIGVIAMKPMAGGNLTDWRLALRYIAQTDVIDIIIPGMGSVEEVERNASAAEDFSPLTEEEKAKCEVIRKELGSGFCRRCNYCAPCTVGIDIPSAFIFNNYLLHYEGMADQGRRRYGLMKAKASACIECGVCETRCPYELPIRKMLKEVAKNFGE